MCVMSLQMFASVLILLAHLLFPSVWVTQNQLKFYQCVPVNLAMIAVATIPVVRYVHDSVVTTYKSDITQFNAVTHTCLVHRSAT